MWCGVVCRRRCYQKAKGRDVYPRVQVNGLGCVCCVRAVRKCVGLGRGRGSRGDLVSSPLATALIPGGGQRRDRTENQTPNISAGTAPAARTGPRPAAAAQAIAATARRRGVVARTAMNPKRIPAATTTMQQPPSSPTRTRGTPTTLGWPWPTTPTLPRPGAPQPTPTATSRTSVGIRETGNPGHGGAQRGHP